MNKIIQDFVLALAFSGAFVFWVFWMLGKI